MASSRPPEDSTLGIRIAGADALSVSVEMDLEDLRSLLEAYLVQSKTPTYRERFPRVDNIREVGDPRISQELDAQLETRIGSRVLECVWMAVPELGDSHDVADWTTDHVVPCGPWALYSCERALIWRRWRCAGIWPRTCCPSLPLSIHLAFV
ncbi:MAG: TIGR04141 family sporadically distributed protein [Acidobacteriota bacterium]